MWPFKKKAINNGVIEYTSEMQKADTYLGAILNTISAIRSGTNSGTYGISPDGKRDYNVLFGYGVDLSYSDYYGMYNRGGIANAVVTKLPRACWRTRPNITINEKIILEKEMASLQKAGFFRALERADILNRIGKFSVLLIGIPDGQDLDKPLGSVGSNAIEDLYFNPYNYDGIEIIAYDTDPSSKRFGLPLIYQLQTTAPDGTRDKIISFKSIKVHYSRLIHLAEGALDSSIEGTSSLDPVWNALIDKDKVRGGSGEAYYRNARQKLALEATNDSNIDTSTDAMAALKKNVEGFQSGWEDVLRLNNMTAKMLQPTLASPKDTFEVAVEEISGTTGIPIRVLTGRGGGNTVGSEDKASWNALVADRSEQQCALWLLDGLQIMADAGIFELPLDVDIEWPVQKSLSDKESSEAIKNRAEAFKDISEGLVNIGADVEISKSIFEAIGFEDVKLDNIKLPVATPDPTKLPPEVPK